MNSEQIQPASSVITFVGQEQRVKEKTLALLLNRRLNNLIFVLFHHIGSASALLKSACAARVLEGTCCLWGNGPDLHWLPVTLLQAKPCGPAPGSTGSLKQRSCLYDSFKLAESGERKAKIITNMIHFLPKRLKSLQKCLATLPLHLYYLDSFHLE